MDKVLIRTATSRDIAQIAAIYAYHVLHGLGTFEEKPPSEQEMVIRLHNIQEQNYPYLVAEYNKHIVGFCYANYYRQRSAYRYTVEDSVYVAHDFQGQRIGFQLLSSLINECKKLSFKQMVAVIGDSNNHGSIYLHKSLGFTHNGTLKKVGFKFNQWVDIVCMQLSLIN